MMGKNGVEKFRGALHGTPLPSSFTPLTPHGIGCYRQRWAGRCGELRGGVIQGCGGRQTHA